MGCPTQQECVSSVTLAFQQICTEVVKQCNKNEDMQTQIYIISGVVGGVLLIILIMVIALFCKLGSASRRADGLYGSNGDELAKRGFSTYTGPQIRESQSPKQVISSPPTPAPYVPATNSPGNNFGYDNANFDPSRSMNPVNSSGGVRVLPRDPPPARNNNQASYNEGYY